MLNVKDKHCFLSLQKKKQPQTHLKQKNMEILDKVLIKAKTLLEITRENIAMRFNSLGRESNFKPVYS